MSRSISCFEESALPEDDDYERARRDLVELLGLNLANVDALDDRIVYKRVPAGQWCKRALITDEIIQ